MSVLAQFEDSLASLHRMLDGSSPETRLKVFASQAREIVRWITIGKLDKTTVVAGLRAVAAEFGLEDDDVQSAIDAAVLNPFDPAAASPPVRPSSASKVGRPRQVATTTAAELERQNFLPVSFVVPNIIPEGLTILAGRPKVGKSWLALDLCLAVAVGGTCFGNIVTNGGDVLYISLEDNPRRLQRRIMRLIAEGWPAALSLTTEWPRMDQGGLEAIQHWLDQARRPRLVVVDTLAGVRPMRTNAGYVEDYECLAPLHRLANDRGVAILVLHHVRKLDADDPIDTVSGTLGLSGCADTILVLKKGQTGTTLYGRGRDVEESERAIEFDRTTCRWRILGEATEVHRSRERQQIVEALGAEQTSVSELVAATGMKRSNLERLLHSMVRDGEAERVGRGRYRFGGAG